MMLWFVAATAMSSTRPPMAAGPMERNRKLDNTGLAERLTGMESRRGGAVCAASDPASAMASAMASVSVSATPRAADGSARRGRGGAILAERPLEVYAPGAVADLPPPQSSLMRRLLALLIAFVASTAHAQGKAPVIDDLLNLSSADRK